MDIAGLSLNMSQYNSMSAVGTSMISKSMDLMETQGAMIADSLAKAPSPSLESLVYPTQGTHIDTTV